MRKIQTFFLKKMPLITKSWSSMKLFPLHVANHPIYDLQHLRNILFDSAKDDICIYLKIVMRYLVTHTHHSVPIHFRILGQ